VINYSLYFYLDFKLILKLTNPREKK